jgi:hypothetical protein
VTLVLDLAPQREGDFSLAERPFSVTVTPLLGSGAALPGWTVTGRVLNPYQAEPPYVTFEARWIAGTAPPEKEVTVRCGVPLAGLTARCDPQQAAVAVEPDGDAFRLHIRPRDDLRVGHHQFSIELSGVDSSGKRLPAGHLRAAAEVVAEVARAPAVLPLGLVPVGSAATREIELRSRTGRPFEVLAVRVPDGAGTTVEPVDTEAGRTIYCVTQRVSAKGSQLRAITFSVRPEGKAAFDLAARISLQGVDPAVAAAGAPGPEAGR